MKNKLSMLVKFLFATKKSTMITIVSVTTIVCFIASSLILVNNFNNQKDDNLCLVRFESNGGTSIEPRSIKCGEKINEPKVPQKDGFTFEYWKYNDNKYDFSKPVLIDILLNAYYKPNDDTEIVKVSFDTSGGTPIEDIEIKKGEKLLKPVDPTMPGHSFAGWYKDFEIFDFNTAIDENITLKAKWEETSTNNSSIKTKTSSNKYKCSGTFRSDIPEKNVMVGYSDHVNWTWSTHGSYGGASIDVCYVTYKTSDSNIAIVNDNGIITTKKAGTVYISECVNDAETKKELICFKGKLNIQDVNDTTTVTSKYDEIANKYSGIWYLEGYADVYINVSKYKMYYEAMSINPMQVDIYNGKIYPSGYGNIQISYENWDTDIKKYNVTLGNNYISIKNPKTTYKFIKTKGTKTKYSNSLFYQALGTWYLYNKPEANFEIYKIGNDMDPAQNAGYCITPNSFDFNTLDYINSSGGSLGCNSGTSNEILEKYGITISDGEMTITNSNGSVKLYKTKKTIPVNNISLDNSSIHLNIGDSKTISYTITPTNAYDKSVLWNSSNLSVATIDNGTIKAVGEGTSVITVTTNDGNKKAICNVTVSKVSVDNISINTNILNLTRGQTSKLDVTISPNNATNKTMTWSSSDNSIATVDNNGNVMAIAKGNAIITVTSNDGRKSASCVVNVNNPTLTAKGNIGISTVVTSSGVFKGVNVTVNASGGSGNYNYYYIKLYRDGTLISQTTNTTNNSLYAIGYTNGSYYAEIEVHDTDGDIYTGNTNATISGF